MIPLRVLGDRVLIRPDVNSNAPREVNGVLLATTMAAAITGEDATTSVCRGTVIAVGNPRHPLREEATSIADKLLLTCGVSHEDDCHITDAAHMLRDLVRRQPCCAVGDDVLFSHDAGQQITIDGETLLLLHEHELLAIVEPEKEAA